MEIIGHGLRKFLEGSERGEMPVFRSRTPWYGPDLQTLRNTLAGISHRVVTHGRLTADIGQAGALSLARTEPVGEDVGKTLLLVHGLGGDENSTYMTAATAYFSRAGWTVFRMNYRGVGPSAQTSDPPYNAGLSGDLVAAVRAIEQAGHSAIHIMGFSLGGHLTLRALAFEDLSARVRAAVTVSAPLDLSACQKKLERIRNKPYVSYLATNMRRDLASLSDHPKVTKNPGALKTVRGFDAHVIAPIFGFEDDEAYYRGVSVKPHIAQIKRPVLALHAVDDPWIPASCYRESDWPEAIAAGAVLTSNGGHVGFHDKTETPWYNILADWFFGQL